MLYTDPECLLPPHPKALAIEPCLTGSDTIVKAKTGTGKTLAFLIPTLERILSVPPHQRRGRVSALILSPTRELAQQIGSEGSRLIGFHRGLRVQVMFGGTNVGRDVKAFTSLPPDILVATPGRLIDHLENSNLAPLLGSLQVPPHSHPCFVCCKSTCPLSLVLPYSPVFPPFLAPSCPPLHFAIPAMAGQKPALCLDPSHVPSRCQIDSMHVR